MNMPSELKEALDASQGSPVEIVDFEKKQAYVVIPVEIYEQMKRVCESDDWDPAALRTTMAKVMEQDWNDPQMDSYDELR